MKARALYAIAYLMTLGAALVLGRVLARSAGVEAQGSALSFFAVVALAGGIVAAGFLLEEPLFWSRIRESGTKVPCWIGQPRSALLAGLAPPPASLGLAVGMVSAMLV